MPVVDKAMYENLKKWCDWNEGIRPENQYLMYVNSHDRALTNATIRKLMFEMTEEDVECELYIAFYSAKNFYRNMRDYYSEISRLYMRTPSDEDPLLDIIEDLPPTCGWLMLIVNDIESMSENSEKIQEMLESILTFAAKRSSVILIGNGDYEDVFSGCEYALEEITHGLSVKEADNELMIGCYDQEIVPGRECIVFEDQQKQCDELNFYWDTLYKQLKHKYFDYTDFKYLYRDTLEYIIPRISKEKVYRKDLWLIENIGAIGNIEHQNIEGCSPWEFEAAKKCACGLHSAIINKYGYYDNLSDGLVNIEVRIDEPTENRGGIYISGSFCETINVSVDTADHEIDKLSEIIHKCTYKGDKSTIWECLEDD